MPRRLGRVSICPIRLPTEATTTNAASKSSSPAAICADIPLRTRKTSLSVAPQLVLGFDVHRTNLAAVLTRVQIGARAVVRMIETETRRPRRECDAARAMRRDKRRAFFGGTIHIRRAQTGRANAIAPECRCR